MLQEDNLESNYSNTIRTNTKLDNIMEYKHYMLYVSVVLECVCVCVWRFSYSSC